MLRKSKLLLTISFIVGTSLASSAQEGYVRVEQDPLIGELMDLKTQMTKNNRLGDRYKIQLYSGNSKSATEAIQKYQEFYPDWAATMVYETPNYKVWVGNFRNSLDADRALLKIREEFPAAFRFKPDKR